MAGCDLINGRLLDDCKERAGIKTVFFFRHSLLKLITRNGAGEITYFGNGTIYRFEQDTDQGVAIQEIQSDPANGSQFVKFQIDMSSYYVTPEFIQVLNAMKNGLWAIFFLDYENNIRLMGELTPMSEIGTVGGSGETAGDTKFQTMTFTGLGGDYAPYLEAFTEYPFDNFPVAIVPPYTPGLNNLLANAVDLIGIDNFGNALSYG